MAAKTRNPQQPGPFHSGGQGQGWGMRKPETDVVTSRPGGPSEPLGLHAFLSQRELGANSTY